MKNTPKTHEAVSPGHPLWGKASWRRTRLPADTPAFDSLFESRGPLEVEIGCGRGDFLNARAARNPARNFLGVETQPNRVKVSRAKTAQNELGNIYFLNTDARLLFNEYLPEASVSMIHVYFPDPWPKTRHFKRRLLNADFFRAVDRVLCPQAVIHLATDHEDYFEFIQEELEKSELSWQIKRHTVNERICDPDLVTEFESRWAAEGRNRYYLEMQK